MTRYHDAAFTLDPVKELPDELAPAAGRDEDEAEEVREAHEEFKEAVEAQAKAAEEKAQEWRERDPKPQPSELLHESGREPAPEAEPKPKAKKRNSEGSEKKS